MRLLKMRRAQNGVYPDLQAPWHGQYSIYPSPFETSYFVDLSEYCVLCYGYSHFNANNERKPEKYKKNTIASMIKQFAKVQKTLHRASPIYENSKFRCEYLGC